MSGSTLDKEHNTLRTGMISFDHELTRMTKQLNQMTHTYQVHDLQIKNEDEKLDPCDNDPKIPLNVLTIAHQSQETYHLHCELIRSLFKTCLQSMMMTFKQNRLMKIAISYLFNRIWTIYYYRTYIWPFANLAYGYAITCHKSQGSTYEKTFVNISNIVGCKKVSEIVRSKSLYTGITRASKQVNLLYSKSLLLPMLPHQLKYQCCICCELFPIDHFPSVNCSIDRQCADQLLSRVKPLSLIITDQSVILVDRYKNLYLILQSELPDIHLNDAYQYIQERHLQRSQADCYQYSNLMMIKNHLRYIDKTIQY